MNMPEQKERSKSLIEYVIPFHEDPEEDFVEFYAWFNLWMTPVAMVVSYSRNRNLKWAVIHGLLGAPYVAYAAADWASREEAKGLWLLAEETVGKPR